MRSTVLEVGHDPHSIDYGTVIARITTLKRDNYMDIEPKSRLSMFHLHDNYKLRHDVLFEGTGEGWSVNVSICHVYKMFV